MFEYQAIALGGWVMPGQAGCIVSPGTTTPGVAVLGWMTAAVGSQKGFQLGCLTIVSIDRAIRATTTPEIIYIALGRQPPGSVGVSATLSTCVG